MKSKLTRLFFGSAALALLATQAAAEGKISGITTKTVGDGLEVQIKGDELSAPKISRVMGGRSFMLEFDATMTSDPQWIRVEQSGVHYVQSVSTGDQKIRIHLRLDPSSKVDVAPDADGFLIKVHNTEEPKTATPAKPQAAPEAIKIYSEPQDLKPPQKSKTAQHETHVHRDRLVSLDFVNTDTVQILKALAMEAGVNIVTSPDVKGNLTISLGSVPIKEALDLVTTMSGLKYGEVNGTYLVTSPANWPLIESNLTGHSQETSETRVVPIYSGEATHIKDALKTTASYVEILLPSEKALSPIAIAQAQQAVSEAQLANFKGADGKNGTPNALSQQGQQNQTNEQTKGQKDTYLILVGPSSRVDAVEKEVKDVDEQMCKVENIDYPLENVMSRTVYHPQGNSAAALLLAISPSTDKTSGGQFHAKIGTVELYATPTGSTSAQNIVLYGRETEVNRLVENLTSIDQLSDSSGDFVIYGVKYLDPRAVREDLLVKFPGLSVSTAPGSAGTPGIYQAGMQQRQAAEKVGQTNGETTSTGAPASAGTSSSGSSTQGVDSGSTPGLNAPFASEEAGAVPMKLVLHGAPDQIKNAIAYLQAIDTEPKQVALELRVMELSKEDALNIGLDWSIITGGKVQAVQLGQGAGNIPTNNANYPNAANANAGLTNPAQTQLPNVATGVVGAVLGGMPGGGTLGITATLDQLANSNKMIARPNVLALDGRESEMFVGDDVKYIQSIQASQNGTTVTTGDVEVGVKLAVLPRVGADGSITMDLRPMVSVLEGFTPVPGGGELPQTGLRIAQSTMIVKSGDTIAIGGLIQDTDTKSKGGIPILSQIPILNLLFGRVNNDHKREEIVFFLTAKVVDHDSMANAANPYANAPAEPHVNKHSKKH
ncbi:MAG TPA: hypothetical protein VGL56_12495 [Fimbriimonadaceae bacterium]|jgi:type II secretory pathway component GspD/PulD (secretin)